MRSVCVESVLPFLSLLLISAEMSARETSKRGCSSFGQMCFGGNGKRFDSDMTEQSLERGGSEQQSLQEELSRNEQLLLLAGGLGLKSKDRDRDRDRSPNSLLIGLASPGLPSTPVSYQSLLKALLDCQSIKPIYLAQAFIKVIIQGVLYYTYAVLRRNANKKPGDIPNFSSELGGI